MTRARCSFTMAALAFAALLVTQGCSPTYPRQKIAASVEKIVMKEYGLQGRARLAGETLYLEVQIPGLVTTDQKVLADILKKVQGAALAITRVSLSSDAKVRFLVLVARDPSLTIHLRIIQRLDDIKGYLYQKISRTDYEDRLILEIENAAQGKIDVSLDGLDRELDMREFVGRLVVSQVNMLSRNNPFLSVLLGNSQLKYESFVNGELVLSATSALAGPSLPVFKEIFTTQLEKTVKKFQTWQPKTVRILSEGAQPLVITPRQ